MNRTSFLTAVLGVFLLYSVAFAQSQDVPKFELAAEFTTFERDDFGRGRTEPGLGGRFTYNLNKTFSLEAAGFFFPKECFNCPNNGRVIQAVGGLKAGKRFESWGIFGKVRPGIVSFSDGEFNIFPTGPVTPTSVFEVQQNRVTSFATDIGAVLEFYPSKRIVTRFDAGDTIIYFTRRTTNTFRFDPVTNSTFIGPVTTPARTTHSFQFMASVGFRF
jgi:hypothetical protein